VLTDAAVRRALDEYIAAYHYFGSRSEASRLYGVSAFPALVLLNFDGTVAKRLTNWDVKTVLEALESREAARPAVAPGSRVLVVAHGNCEFGCAHRLDSILKDPEIQRLLRGRGVTNDRSRLKTERHAFFGMLDEQGRPVGDVLGAESSLEEARAWFRRRVE
jgi:hypothetical protein